jgi:hypothetical protein
MSKNKVAVEVSENVMAMCKDSQYQAEVSAMLEAVLSGKTYKEVMIKGLGYEPTASKQSREDISYIHKILMKPAMLKRRLKEKSASQLLGRWCKEAFHFPLQVQKAGKRSTPAKDKAIGPKPKTPASKIIPTAADGTRWLIEPSSPVWDVALLTALDAIADKQGAAKLLKTLENKCTLLRKRLGIK